jgi:signal transduction histidine kinase
MTVKIRVQKAVNPADSTEMMIAALAHEIKNPLNSMKGAGQYLYNKYGNIADIKEFTGIIISEIERLDRYLNEFLSFSRGIKLRLKTTNIATLITGIVMTVKHSFPCEISVTANGHVPDISVDAEQLRQVLVNLLSNAKDALFEGNSVRPRVDITARADNRNVYISVIDNGAGMTGQVMKNIFVPFYTTKDSGIGIGLAISKTIIEKHGGKIKVRSTPGKGSEFILVLPVKA